MRSSLRRHRVLKGCFALLLCLGSAAGQCSCPCLPLIGAAGSVDGMVNGQDSATVVAGSEVALTALITTGILVPEGSVASWSQLVPPTPLIAFEARDGGVTVFTAPDVASTTTFTLEVRAGGALSDVVNVTVVPVEGAERPVPTVGLEVIEGDVVLLDGFAVIEPAAFDTDTFDPTAHRAIWRQTSPDEAGLQVDLQTSPDNLFAAFVAEFDPMPAPGPIVLQFQLDIFDAAGDIADPATAIASALVNVTVRRRPIADAGPYQLVLRPPAEAVQLDGTASVDLDGPPDNSGLVFLWVQIEGPAVELVGALTPAPSFSIVDLPTNRNHRLVFALVVVNGPIPAGPILAATTLEEVQAAIAELAADFDTVEIAAARNSGGGGAPDNGPQEEPCDPVCESPAVCLDGLCLIPCDDEFCTLDEVCTDEGCIALCGESVCPPDLVCVDGACLERCGEGFCPPELECVEGACLEPCGEEFCPPGRECVEGDCLEPCGEGFCPQDLVCVEGECLEPCGEEFCPPGEVCGSEGCVVQCGESLCAPGEVCIDNQFCGELCDGVFCGPQVFCDAGCGCDFDGDMVGELCDQCPDNPFATEEPCFGEE